MKKSAKPKAQRNLDKHLFEAGQQCPKRLWLDYHQPGPEPSTARRQEMSRVGDELRALARTAFPMAVTVAADDITAAAEETAKAVADGAPVLFDAAFVADGVEVRCDILVMHKDKRVDLFEIKSGTKVKHRYVNDLALQATVLAHEGLEMQRAYLLHVNPNYAHTAGEDYPPMELMRSSDVTQKVQKQLPNVVRKLGLSRKAAARDTAPEVAMGTFCRSPFACPHMAACAESAPERPLHQLPEISRVQETELVAAGFRKLSDVPLDHEGLTFRQRRTLQCHERGERIVEDFVSEDLAECDHPLHFVAMTSVTDPLPRFDLQKPWQRTPYAWAVKTVHEDGRVESKSFAQVDRDDPRGAFVRGLSRHLEMGGTALVWDEAHLRDLRGLLDSLPDEKGALRMLLGQDVLDMRALFESGVFDPELSRYDDLTEVSALLLGDPSGRELEALDGDARYELVHKARAPRVRSTTRDKITAQMTEALNWQAERLYALYDAFCTEEDREAARRADAEADRQEADRQQTGQQDAEPDAPQQLPE